MEPWAENVVAAIPPYRKELKTVVFAVGEDASFHLGIRPGTTRFRVVEMKKFKRLVAVEALEHKNEAFFDRLSLIFEFVVELRTKK